ncbi:MAG: hypothetical protein JSS71_04920 [Armatimonadetes bacterium]|nr:hypothetical protein [Armatimonadota bacterium]MBX3108726.1 hypothetical protein [Fimbriimonadaceae bacterium]
MGKTLGGYFLLSEKRFQLALFFLAVLSAVGIATGYDTDSLFYRAMASGRYDGVPAPFRTRIVTPWLIQQVSVVLPVDVAAWLIQIAVGMVFLFGLAKLFQLLEIAPEWFWFSAFLAPFVAGVTEPFMPEMLSSALIVWALVCLQVRQTLGFLLLCALMGLQRESALLFGLVALPVLYRSNKWAAIGSLPAAAAGLFAAVRFVGGGASAHQLSWPVYMLLKIPANISRNVFGFSLWSNVLADTFGGEPWLKWASPVKVGAITEIGVYNWEFGHPVILAGLMTSLFGLAISMLWLRRRSIRQEVAEAPPAVAIAFWYGLASLLAAPSLGAGVGRLLCYAWPLPTVALAWWAHRTLARSQPLKLLWWHYGFALAGGVSLSIQEWWPRIILCGLTVAALFGFRRQWEPLISEQLGSGSDNLAEAETN